MVLSNPFPGHTALTTFADLRRDLEGLVARNSAGVMRAGVFPDHLSPLVTGRSDMKVNIGDFRAVQNRGGAVLLANVGTDTSVTLPAAPGANKRIDLIYVTMRSAALGDAASTPLFGFVQGTASATPVAPSLPANLSTAIPLATVEIPAGATTTLSAGVVITQVYPYTALAGGTVVVRNSVELAAWTPADGSRAFCLADTGEYVRANGVWGGQWVDLSTSINTLYRGACEARKSAGIIEVRYASFAKNIPSGVTTIGNLPAPFRPSPSSSPNNISVRSVLYLDATGPGSAQLGADGNFTLINSSGAGRTYAATSLTFGAGS